MLKQKLLDILSFIGITDMTIERIQENIIEKVLVKIGLYKEIYGKDILKALDIDCDVATLYPDVRICQGILYLISVSDIKRLKRFMKKPLEDMPMYINMKYDEDKWYPFLSWYRLKIGR